jgi:hypothetical protein
MLPPMVAVSQILNYASSAVQHRRSNGAATQSDGNDVDNRATSAIVQVAASSMPLSSNTIGRQPSPVMSISLRTCGCGSENSHVPPASSASPRRSGHSCSRLAGALTTSTVLRSTNRR